MPRRLEYLKPALARQYWQCLALAHSLGNGHRRQPWHDHHLEDEPQHAMGQLARRGAFDGWRVEWMGDYLRAGERREPCRAANVVRMLMCQEDAPHGAGLVPDALQVADNLVAAAGQAGVDHRQRVRLDDQIGVRGDALDEMDVR